MYIYSFFVHVYQLLTLKCSHFLSCLWFFWILFFFCVLEPLYHFGDFQMSRDSSFLKHLKWRESHSIVSDSATPWTIRSMEFSRPEYWSGYCFPSPGDLPNPGIKRRSPALQADYLPAEPQGKPKNVGVGRLSLLQQIFPTQELNGGLLHGKRTLYQLS